LGFAFAQWGGDFWLFTAVRDPTLPAFVAQYSFDAGTVVKTLTGDVGGQSAIVGAGVSTCAPYAPSTEARGFTRRTARTTLVATTMRYP
jgi:hypothetical protein